MPLVINDFTSKLKVNVLLNISDIYLVIRTGSKKLIPGVYRAHTKCIQPPASVSLYIPPVRGHT